MLTRWHGGGGVGLVPGDQVGEIGEAGIGREVLGDEGSQDVGEFAIWDLPLVDCSQDNTHVGGECLTGDGVKGLPLVLKYA